MAVGDINSEEKGSGARYNTGKPAMELIPAWIIASSEIKKNPPSDDRNKNEAIKILHSLGNWQKGIYSADSILDAFQDSPWKDCADVFEYGKKKYAAWNWTKGMVWSIPTACIIRHCLAILNGELVDPESGLPHRGHVACNVVMLIQYEQTFKEGDDRPVKWLTVDNSEISSINNPATNVFGTEHFKICDGKILRN